MSKNNGDIGSNTFGLIIIIIIICMLFGALIYKDYFSGGTSSDSSSSSSVSETSSSEDKTDPDEKATDADTAAETTTAATDGKTTYTVVPGKYTWEQAKAYCEANGGQLAVINSEDDWEAIVKAVSESGISDLSYLWLGGKTTIKSDVITEKDNEVALEWVDGSDTSYVMSKNFSHWYKNGTVSEPTGFDVSKYEESKKNGEMTIVLEPYLLMWSVSGNGEWTLNDICDVSDEKVFFDYNDKTMGFVMENRN